MNIVCTVDILTRHIALPAGVQIASYDHNVDVVQFNIEPIEDFSLNTSSIKIAAQGPNKARHDYAVDPSTVAIEEETGYITFDWPIPAGVTEMPIGTFKYGDRGQLIFAVCAEIISGDTVSKAWHSDDGIITVVAHLEPEAGGGEDPSEEATNAQKIGQLQTATAILQREISGIASGTPPTASTIAEMDAETSTVYIYTGSESGESTGYWYYYNGTTFVPGGQYGGAVTSTTFNQHGVPADDFAVGEALGGLGDRVTVLESGSSGGLTADIKSALLACFANVAWAGDDGQDFYDALDAALNPPAGLVSISAVYTQSGTVYDTASIDSLKPDLVVTAHYDNATTQVITTYTLSGTLTEGTSTITVAYGGKTTTFNVTVTSLMETITITFSGSGADSTTQVIDATSSELYWRLPYVQNATQYASGATSESAFVKIETVLFNDANKENLAGFYYIDTGEIANSGRTGANKPVMPVDTLIKVAPSGYYAVIKVTKQAGFTDNAGCRSFLNTYATDAQLAHVGE